jgi:hypothetical protein
MGEEVPRLEDCADVAAVDAERFSGGRNGFVVDAERSLFGRLQSADEAQESGFAATGGSEQSENMGEIECGRDVVDHGVVAVALG